MEEYICSHGFCGSADEQAVSVALVVQPFAQVLGQFDKLLPARQPKKPFALLAEVTYELIA